MSDIDPWPVIPPDQLHLLNLDKIVRTEYNDKRNLTMG